jgi:hypothetical protein
MIPSNEQSRGIRAMMGRLEDRQQSLFYDFCLDDHVPQDHLLRRIDECTSRSQFRDHGWDES